MFLAGWCENLVESNPANLALATTCPSIDRGVGVWGMFALIQYNKFTFCFFLSRLKPSSVTTTLLWQA